MTGIYKITSPTGNVYIGQSWKIITRRSHYSSLNCKEQPKLYYSLKKHGFAAHDFAVLYTLPEGITQSVLDQYEIFVLSQFKEAGVPLLNLKEGGSSGKLSAESIDKIKLKRSTQLPPSLGKKHSEETKLKMSAAATGVKKSAQHIENSRTARTGAKATDETRAKLRQARSLKNVWIGRKHTDNSRAKQSTSKIGNKCHNKLVLNVQTGIYYNSLSEAAFTFGVTMKHLSYRMNQRPNSIPFVYV